MRTPTVLLFTLLVSCSGDTADGDRAAFLTLLGQDTLTAETITWTASGFEGQVVQRAPVTQRTEYRGEVGPEGDLMHFTARITVPGDTTRPPREVALTVEDTMAVSVVSQGELSDTTHIPVSGVVVPSMPQVAGLQEVVTRLASRAGSDSFPVQLIGVGARRATPNAVVRATSDSVSILTFGSPLMIRVDAEGRVLGTDGGHTTMKTTTTRLPDLDLAAVESAFLARERQSQGQVVLSGRDTVEATVGGAEIWVDYGRPSKRGREVFGGRVVPFGEVWRTGANAATQIRVSRALRVGEHTIPAGMYTLFSLPTAEGATLIVNRQTGQWGTGYDASQDLVHLPLQVESLDEPVEMFTIAVELTEGSGGTLVLSWDRTRWSLPFTVE